MTAKYIVSGQIGRDFAFEFEAVSEMDAWAKAALELAREARRHDGERTLHHRLVRVVEPREPFVNDGSWRAA